MWAVSRGGPGDAGSLGWQESSARAEGEAAVCYHEARSVGQVPAAKLNAYALSGDGATLDLFVSLYRGTGEAEDVGLPETRRQFKLFRGFLRIWEHELPRRHESRLALKLRRALERTWQY